MDEVKGTSAELMPLSAEALKRMPLAEAAFSIWRFVFNEERLQGI